MEHWKGSHVKDILFGIEDGVVTALGTVLAVSAATSNSSLVVIAGIAALFAEAISMFFGSYISRKSEIEILQRHRKRFAKLESPIRLAAIFWLATMVGIFVVLPFFFFDVRLAMYASIIMSTIVLFVSGAAKTIFTRKSWIKSGVEMMLIGMIAATVGYIVGIFLGITIT